MQAQSRGVSVQNACSDQLSLLVTEHRFCSHPFFDEAFLGRDGGDLLRVWLGQQYYMSISLSPAFAALAARAPAFDWQAGHNLLSLALEESWGSSQSHGRLLVAFAQSIGVDLLSFPARISQKTREAAQSRINICLGAGDIPFVASAQALAWGNEFANLLVFGKLARIVSRHFPVSDDRYFKAHLTDETEHHAAIVERAPITSEDELMASVSATAQLLEVRAGMLDAVLDAADR